MSIKANNDKDYVIAVRNLFNASQLDLALSIGVSKGYISLVEIGKTKLTDKYKRQIEAIELGELPLYKQSGKNKGQILNQSTSKFDKEKTSNKQVTSTSETASPLIIENNIYIDEILDIYTTCKSGIFIPPANIVKVAIQQNSIRNYRAGNNYIRFTVFGDDMEPEIKNGDKLIFKTFDKDIDTIENNVVYAIRYNKDFFVRRLVKNLNKIYIKADNPAQEYETIVLDENSDDFKMLTVIGKIVSLQRLF